MIYVYILKLNNFLYYTGITNNLNRRMHEHRHKKGGFTKWFHVIDLVYFDFYANRAMARKIEVYIKSIGAKKFLLLNKCNL
jgi:putative endonuclease